MSKTLTNLMVYLKGEDKLSKPLKKAQKSAKELGRQIYQTRDRLKEIDKTSKNIEAFKRLKAETEQSSHALEKQRGVIRHLRRQLVLTGKPTKLLTARMKEARSKAQELSKAHQKNIMELSNLSTVLKAAKVDTLNLAKAESKLKNESSKLNAGLIERKKKLREISAIERQQAVRKKKAGARHRGGMTLAGHGLGAGAVAGGLFTGLAALSSAGMEFEATMSKVQALSRLGKNSSQMKALTQQARNLGASTSFSAVQAANAQAFLAMAGFNPKAIQQALPGLLDMSKAGGADLGRGADIASNILGSFKLQPREMGKVADILTKAFTTSNTNLEMLANTMRYVGPVAKSAGMNLETAAAMAGLLGNVGIQSEKAGTTLRAMLLRLSAPTGAASKAMKKLGLNTRDATGNVRNMVDILADTAKATEKMGSGERLQVLKDIFGEEPASGMAELIAQAGSGGISKYLDVIKNHSGAAKHTAKVMGDNLSGLVKQYNSAMADLKISLFDEQSGALSDLLRTITKFIRSINAWIKNSPDISKKTLHVVAAFSALLAIVAPLLTGIGLITMGMGALGLATAPVAAIIAVIGGLVAAAAAIYVFWKPIKNFFKEVWDAVYISTSSRIQSIKDFIVESFTALPAKLAQIGKDMIAGLVGGIKSAMGSVKEAVTSVGTGTVNWFKNKLGIRSPSRVFAALGDDTMAGLAVGINRSANTPLNAVRHHAKNLAASGALAASIAASPVAAVTQSAATTAPVGDHITINITAPAGVDAQTLAALVRDTLDERDRQKAARGRSALYDTD